jgi:hypothetical protein
MRRRLLVVSAAFAVFASNAQAATYYVSRTGSDANSGTSPATAWQTIKRVNNASLAPGDTVLFQGGSTFGDATLMPPASGTPAAPITFASYGTGLAGLDGSSGAVWIADGRHDLVFQSLDLSSAGGGVFSDAGSGSVGVDDITVRNSRIHDTPNMGLQANSARDDGWKIQNDLFEHTGDSAVLLLASGTQVTGNTFRYTGENTSITYGKHAIYDKGPNTVIADNDFSHDTGGQEISIRFRGAQVYGNAIHDTGSAIAYFADDPTPGVIRIYDNRAWNITDYGFYYGGDSLSASASPVGVVLASNTFQFANASEAVNVWEAASADMTIANNVFTGSYGSALRTATGSGTTSEHNNDWFGAGRNVPSGSGDLRVDPTLSAPSYLAPSAGSPVDNKGSTSGAGVTYTAACDGQPLHYCGAAPDLGAVEYLALPLTPPPADTQAPSRPSGLAVTGAGTSWLTLAWKAATDNVGVAGYAVFVNGAKVATGSSLRATVGGLTCGTSYRIGVLAFDAAGNRSALASITGKAGACKTRYQTRKPRLSSWRSALRPKVRRGQRHRGHGHGQRARRPFAASR